LQEANKLVPNVGDTVCLVAKAWSDVCYLDEIFKERLTDQQKRDVNMKAIKYSRQVLHPSCSLPSGRWIPC
jgi:hypothetical protein